MNRARRLRIASRGSRLALWQSEWVRSRLLAEHPGLTVEIEVVRTTGDRILDVPLAKIGDRGLFTKEIDDTLLAGNAEIAVHSLKDVPTRTPDGLTLAAISKREDPRDILLFPVDRQSTLGTLPAGSRVGTSSLRRRAQIGRLRPDLQVVDLRGNLDTRLRKLDAGEYEAIVLAVAGLARLGWLDRGGEILEPGDWLPAVGQGALAVVARADDVATISLLTPLNHPDTAAAVTAERSFLRALEGGCQVPIGALATLEGGTLRLDGLVADVSGTRILRDSAEGAPETADALGLALAERLLERGAGEILRAVREAANAPGVPAS